MDQEARKGKCYQNLRKHLPAPPKNIEAKCMEKVCSVDVHQALPFISQGVAVTAGMAAIGSALFPLPISVILLVSLMSKLT